MSASLKRPAETNGGGGPPASDTNEGGDLSRQRKFFPRLKTLLSDEYEDVREHPCCGHVWSLGDR